MIALGLAVQLLAAVTAEAPLPHAAPQSALALELRLQRPASLGVEPSPRRLLVAGLGAEGGSGGDASPASFRRRRVTTLYACSLLALAGGLLVPAAADRAGLFDGPDQGALAAAAVGTVVLLGVSALTFGMGTYYAVADDDPDPRP